MSVPDLTERIRSIFLHPEPHVTKNEAAALLGWSFADLQVAIATGEIVTCETCSGVRIPLSEVATIARERWQGAMIEEALGADARAILPPSLRTRSIRLRLSRYQIAVLEHVAAKEGVTIDAVAARKIDLLTSEYAEELAGVIEDVAAALNWPEPKDIQPQA